MIGADDKGFLLSVSLRMRVGTKDPGLVLVWVVVLSVHVGTWAEERLCSSHVW